MAKEEFSRTQACATKTLYAVAEMIIKDDNITAV